MDNKVGLILSGGGAKGAFQLGALNRLNDVGYKYKRIYGVSVGALNGSMIAVDALKRLNHIWNSISDKSIYKKKSLAKLASKYAMYKIGVGSPPTSLYSNKPLEKLLFKELSKYDNFKIPFRCGRVSLVDGLYRSHISQKITNLTILRVLDSTRIPIIWSPRGSRMLVDGGVRDVSPTSEIIGEDLDEVIIITNKSRHTIMRGNKVRDIFDVAKSTLDILLDEIFNEDINRFIDINNFVRQADAHNIKLEKKGKELKYYRTSIIEPSENLGDPLDFSQKSIQDRKMKGYKTAKKIIG